MFLFLGPPRKCLLVTARLGPLRPLISRRQAALFTAAPGSAAACWNGPGRPLPHAILQQSFSTSIVAAQNRRNQWAAKIGGEPGLTFSDKDSSAPSYDVEIKVVDYSQDDVKIQDVPQSDLSGFLTSKPDWASCRWVYVNGIDRGIVQTLGHQYGLHPLTLEDTLNIDNLAKVDWYDDHCFLEMTLQKLVDVVQHEEPEVESNGKPRRRRRFSYAPDSVKDVDLTQQLEKPGKHFYEAFDMVVEQVSVYLTADKTVITIFERSGDDIFNPIWARLQSPHTILRSSNDPSMLVQGVVDTVVDLSVPVGKAFADAFTDLELAVLTKPSLVQSRQVYVLRAGLMSFLELLTPIASLVRALCDHRDVGVHAATTADLQTNEAATRTPSRDFASRAISPMAQAYLKDVQDHVGTLTSSTYRSIRSAENLSSLIFNTIAARQNESVRQLTLVSIFFLPLTFLTGYFGMVRHLSPRRMLR